MGEEAWDGAGNRADEDGAGTVSELRIELCGGERKAMCGTDASAGR